METAPFFETLVSTYESTRHQNPEERRHLNRHQEPQISYKAKWFLA